MEFVLATETDKSNASYIGQWSIEQHTDSLSNEDIAHFIIENAQGDRVGYVILTGLKDPHKAVCMKRIANRIKDRGYGKATMKQLLNWVFESTDAHRVWLHVKDYNQRARHVYESAGFVTEGLLRESYLYESKFESIVVMSVLRTEYRAPL